MDKKIYVGIALILVVAGATTVALVNPNVALGMILFITGREMLRDARKIVVVHKRSDQEMS